MKTASGAAGTGGGGAVVRQLAAGLWVISAVEPLGRFTQNCYLASVDGSACVIDPGPAVLAPSFASEAASIVEAASLRHIVLLDADASAWSGLPAWLAAGFKAKVLADWRVAELLSLAALPAEIEPIEEGSDEVELGGGVGWRILHAGRKPGAIALLHPSGHLFSGCLASARLPASGRDKVPETWEDPSLGPQRDWVARFGWTGSFSDREGRHPLEADASGPAKGIGPLCPRFGPCVPAKLAKAVAQISPESACEDPATQQLELERLRSSNYALRESMVGYSDAALRDPVTGLYGRGYADAFLQSLFDRSHSFSAAFIRVDRIKDLNRRIGPRAVDQTLKDLAALLIEREPETYLFRWTGPIFLMVSEGEGKESFAHLDALRRAIETEPRFTAAITVSIALVESGRLTGERLSALISASRIRLKLLERRGGNAILDRSDARDEERSMVLALDPDQLFLDYLVEGLNREGFKTLGATRGGQALEMMDGMLPELIIADKALPQFDAFQIRSRMRSSSDLHDIPFILITRDKSDETVARAHSLAIYHILQKPVSMVELTGIARSLISRSEDGA